MLKTYFAVMLGGAVGTGARMWLSGFIALRFQDKFPIGILAVNVSGCLIMGLFSALTETDGPFPAPALLRLTVMVGVLGGFTTFSSFGLQTYTLMTDGEWLRAGLNAVLSLVLCIAGVWLGHLIATMLQHR